MGLELLLRLLTSSSLRKVTTSCSQPVRSQNFPCNRYMSHVTAQPKETKVSDSSFNSLRREFLEAVKTNDIDRAYFLRQRLTEASRDRCSMNTAHAPSWQHTTCKLMIFSVVLLILGHWVQRIDLGTQCHHQHACKEARA